MPTSNNKANFREELRGKLDYGRTGKVCYRGDCLSVTWHAFLCLAGHVTVCCLHDKPRIHHTGRRNSLSQADQVPLLHNCFCCLDLCDTPTQTANFLFLFPAEYALCTLAESQCASTLVSLSAKFNCQPLAVLANHCITGWHEQLKT